MTDRLRGVEQVGQPDPPVPIPIDEAKPVMEAAAAAGFAVSADERVVIARQVTEVEQERRQRMEETADAIAEAVAIVRDLADTNDDDLWDSEYDWCRVCHGAPHETDCAFTRAKAWVAAHPVSGDQQ